MKMSQSPNTYEDHELYRDSARVPLSARIGRQAREDVHRIFSETLAPRATTSILDVGVSDDNATDATNMLERLHPWPAQLVCAGIQEGSGFRAAFPNHRYVRIAAGRPLPFADKSFDIAYSNAVIEHVGSWENQRAFVAELERVARHVFITAPNRWFPIEHHTGLPFLHWLPISWFRALLRRSRFAFWTKEENLHLLTRRDLVARFATRPSPQTCYAGVGFGMFKSNIIAYG